VPVGKQAMAEEGTGFVEAPPSDYSRVVGSIGDDLSGPTVIVMAGLHGNEPSGVEAATRVLSRLQARSPQVAGRFIALSGNLEALRERTRFIDRDLNRQWTPDKVEAALALEGSPEAAPEEREMIETLRVVRQLVEEAQGLVYFLDLHTSSAEGPPFVTVGDTLRNRRFARKFPLPLILGLEEQVDGAMLEYLNNFGLITMGVEAGQHDSEMSVDRHEAVLWLSLEATGLIEAGAIPDREGWVRVLREATLGIPRVVEVRHRHAISPEDGFRMEPGFRNFMPIRKRQLMAQDARGPVRATEDGMVLLPLYQGKGDDGFFLCREVHGFWLGVSRSLRRFGLAGLVQFLPGVTRDPVRHEILHVNTLVARWFPLEIFHLLGFRKLRRGGHKLVVSRRRFDAAPPRRTTLV